jgi:hypothetical protein
MLRPYGGFGVSLSFNVRWKAVGSAVVFDAVSEVLTC